MIELSASTEALARRLAEAQSLSIDETVRQALVARERDIPKPAGIGRLSPEVTVARRAAIDRAVSKIAALPILDPRSPQEIMDDLDPI